MHCGLKQVCSLKLADKFRLHGNQMSGNPVKFGDGCATVTSYKLPQATARVAGREGGSEVIRSKSGYRFGCARPLNKLTVEN